MKIIIVTHKEECVLDNSIFRPIQVGAENANYTINSKYYKDNDAIENISQKNPNYCELTALFWMWKSLTNEPIVGLNHYRRYFNFLNKSIFKPHRIQEIYANDSLILRHNSKAEFIEKRVEKWLNSYDVILPYSRNVKLDKKKTTIAKEYCVNHLENDWLTTIEIIKQKYPEYVSSIDKHFNNSGNIYLMNIFVAKSEWANKYCFWLFSILFELEKNIVLSNDPYQKRVFGFISERLLTLYVKHHEYKVKELPLIFIKNMF